MKGEREREGGERRGGKKGLGRGRYRKGDEEVAGKEEMLYDVHLVQGSSVLSSLSALNMKYVHPKTSSSF